MRTIQLVLVLVAALGLTACSNSKFKTYDGPEVTSVLMYKDSRKIYLLHGNQVLESYDMELGFSPVGTKQVERDGRTPEGVYLIDKRNPNSKYHLSVGISYPNERDREIAAALGMSPGGDIFIHGTPKEFRGRKDWTAGCIAVSNKEIEQIYAMVQNGTPIYIYP